MIREVPPYIYHQTPSMISKPKKKGERKRKKTKKKKKQLRKRKKIMKKNSLDVTYTPGISFYRQQDGQPPMMTSVNGYAHSRDRGSQRQVRCLCVSTVSKSNAFCRLSVRPSVCLPSPPLPSIKGRSRFSFLFLFLLNREYFLNILSNYRVWYRPNTVSKYRIPYQNTEYRIPYQNTEYRIEIPNIVSKY